MSQPRPGLRAAALGVALAAGMLLASCGSSGSAAPSPTSSGAHSSHSSHSAPPETPAAADASSPATDGNAPSSEPPIPLSSDAQTPTENASAPQAASDIAGACAALIKVDAIEPPSEGPEGPPSPAAVKQFGDAVLPLLTEAAGKGDAELAGHLAVLKPVAEAAATDGTPIPDDEKVMGAVAGYHAWAHDTCGFSNVDVTAVDYQFKGVPATIKAGPISLAMANQTTKGEFHVALIVRPKDESITSVDQLLAIPLPELEQGVDMVGSAAAPPGATGGALLDLKPGRYFMVCPVPVGGDETSDDIHMMHGMATVFEVV